MEQSNAINLSLKPSLQISSVTSHFDLKTRIDLKSLVNKMYDIYVSKTWKFIKKEFRHPHGFALIYRSGKVTLMGHKSIEEALVNGQRIVRFLNIRAGYLVTMTNFRTSQVCGEARFPRGIKFNDCINDPTLSARFSFLSDCDMFAMIYLPQPGNNKIKARVYQNGRTQIFCAKTKEQVNIAFNELCSLLKDVPKIN